MSSNIYTKYESEKFKYIIERLMYHDMHKTDEILHAILTDKLWDMSASVMNYGTIEEKSLMKDWALDCEMMWKNGRWADIDDEEEEELPKLNIKTGFLKKTHELICRVCGLPDYAESCGEWDDDGNLTGVICGECDEEERKEEEEEEEEEEEDDGSNTCYAVKERHQKTFIMSGGHGDWWNYVVVFDDDGEQKEVYIETKNGLELCEDQRLIQTSNKHGDYRIKCVYIHYELNEDKEESWITNTN